MDESHNEGTADRRMLSDRRTLKLDYKSFERRFTDRRTRTKENAPEIPPVS